VTLAHSGWLWLLALAIPLVAFHLRMRRKVRVIVPSLLAYDAAALGGAPPRALGLRPRDLLALLLECGALACLSLAAAGPVSGGPPSAPRLLALVLDGSASTLAAGRFEEERALARRALDAAGPGTPVTLLLAAGTPRVLASSSEPRERIEAALAAARPLVVGAGALAAAADMAARSGAETVVLTDGCDPDVPALARRADLRIVSVGKPERNRAIVGGVLDLRRDGRHSLFLRIREEDGSIREEDRSAAVRGPSALPRAARGPLRVDLGGAPDALAADDFIEFRAASPAPLRVAVVAPGGKADAWLSAALEACGEVIDGSASTTVDPSALADLSSAPDVLILAGAGPATGRPALVLGAGTGEPLEAPSVQAGERLHPVLRGVDPTEWIVTKTRTLEASAGDAVLLQGPKGPLAIAGLRGGARRVLLGFDPRESTIPLSGSWPVFLRNALLWLAGGSSGDPGADAPAPAAARDPVRGPLLDAAESDLSPRVPRDADAFAPAARAGPGAGPRPLAPVLAGAAAALLLLEWLLFALGPLAAARRAPAGPVFLLRGSAPT
jgi:hypothetical protein